VPGERAVADRAGCIAGDEQAAEAARFVADEADPLHRPGTILDVGAAGVFVRTQLHVAAKLDILETGAALRVVHHAEESGAERIALVVDETGAADVDQALAAIDAERAGIAAVAGVAAGADRAVALEQAVDD